MNAVRAWSVKWGLGGGAAGTVGGLVVVVLVTVVVVVGAAAAAVVLRSAGGIGWVDWVCAVEREEVGEGELMIVYSGLFPSGGEAE